MKTKILLVDDEVDLAALFRKRFRPQIQANTYEFVFVYDALEALSLLEQQPDIDLVLSDINMPGMDGLTLLTKIPEINPIVRTVMVTAYGDMDNIRLAMNRGAFDFLTKPINFDDLEVTIEKARKYVQQARETAELKAMDAMKTRFFANITHELRAPLSLIISPVDTLLERTDLPTPYQHQLNTVRRNAHQLLRLINQLLDIHKQVLSEDGLEEGKRLVGHNARRCGRIVAIAVLNNQMGIRFIAPFLAHYFARRIKPDKLLILARVIMTQSNIPDFINAIRYLSIRRTTAPRRIAKNRE